MAISGLVKKLSDYLPILRDQGIEHLCAASSAGVSLQSASLVAMPADGALTFAELGMSDMADSDYALIVHNHSDAADEATCLANARTATGFTLTGPDEDDLLDIVVVGRLADQLA